MTWRGKVALATVFALGMTVGQAHAEERLSWDQRHDRIRYETLENPQWTARETVLTITAAADRFNVSRSVMMCIARRESNLDEDAYNSYSGASGLFQHLRRYWPSRVRSYNHGVGGWLDVKPNASPFSARANALVSARMMRAGGFGPWGGGC
jgi:hypothetical protein